MQGTDVDGLNLKDAVVVFFDQSLGSIPMKTLKCDLCDADIQGEDFEAWFKAAYAHWTAEHGDVMKQMADKPKEEGEKWMADAKKRFEAA